MWSTFTFTVSGQKHSLGPIGPSDTCSELAWSCLSVPAGRLLSEVNVRICWQMDRYRLHHSRLKMKLNWNKLNWFRVKGVNSSQRIVVKRCEREFIYSRSFAQLTLCQAPRGTEIASQHIMERRGTPNKCTTFSIAVTVPWPKPQVREISSESCAHGIWVKHIKPQFFIPQWHKLQICTNINVL